MGHAERLPSVGRAERDEEMVPAAPGCDAGGLLVAADGGRRLTTDEEHWRGLLLPMPINTFLLNAVNLG